MKNLAWSRWSFLTPWWAMAMAIATTIADAASTHSGTVLVDLVFPRNDTYAPTPLLPIIFGFQNSELASFLNPRISFTAWDLNNSTASVGASGDSYDVRWANFSSSDPYFAYTGFKAFNREGSWRLRWTVTWDSCTNDSLNSNPNNDGIITNSSDNSLLFTTRNSAPEVDLVAATADNNDDDCGPAGSGTAVSVTDTLDVPSLVDWSGGDTCAVVASPTSTLTSCHISIGSSSAASISAAVTAKVCETKDIYLPSGVTCPEEGEGESAAQGLVIGGVMALAAGLGVILIIFV